MLPFAFWVFPLVVAIPGSGVGLASASGVPTLFPLFVGVPGSGGTPTTGREVSPPLLPSALVGGSTLLKVFVDDPNDVTNRALVWSMAAVVGGGGGGGGGGPEVGRGVGEAAGGVVAGGPGRLLVDLQSAGRMPAGR